MNELIDRQAAIDVGRDLIIPVDGYHMYNQAINNYCAELTNLPAAEHERKTGHWIMINDFYNGISGECSVCGWQAHSHDDDVAGMDYCPNCGARLMES